MKKTTNGFARLSWPEFRALVAVIVRCMTGNAYFPTLQPQVANLSALADKYYVLDTNSRATRDKNVLISRNATRVELTGLLHQMGFAVSSICNGNEEMLASSGFPFTKPAQKSSPLRQPKPPKLSLGVNTGVIKVKTARQKGVLTYKYYITAATGANRSELAADASWTIESTNYSQFNFENLVSGQRYFFKVGMIGVRNQEVISEAASYIPQ